MGDRYRVTVERLTPAADGIGDDYTSVVELLAEAHVLARFAPGAVAEALGGDDGEETEAAPGPDGTPAAPRQQRKRRTKAEIAADKAREEADARAAAGQVAEPLNQTPSMDASSPAPAAAPPFAVTTTFEGAKPLATGGIIGGGAPGSFNPFEKQGA